MTPDSDSTFAERLRFLRKRLKKSQEEISEILGVTQHTYSMYENSKSFPSVKIIQKLKQFPNIDLNWLIFGEHTSFIPDASNDPPLAELFYWINKVPIVRHSALASLEDCKFKYQEIFKDKDIGDISEVKNEKKD